MSFSYPPEHDLQFRSVDGQVFSEAFGSELHLANFLPHHVGNYSCTASNPLGQVTGSIQLVEAPKQGRN